MIRYFTLFLFTALLAFAGEIEFENGSISANNSLINNSQSIDNSNADNEPKNFIEVIWLIIQWIFGFIPYLIWNELLVPLDVIPIEQKITILQAFLITITFSIIGGFLEGIFGKEKE